MIFQPKKAVIGAKNWRYNDLVTEKNYALYAPRFLRPKNCITDA